MDFWTKAGPNLVIAGIMVALVGVILMTDGHGPAVIGVGVAIVVAGMMLRTATRQAELDRDDP